MRSRSPSLWLGLSAGILIFGVWAFFRFLATHPEDSPVLEAEPTNADLAFEALERIYATLSAGISR